MKPRVANPRFRIFCVRITPKYGLGPVIRITQHPRNLLMSNGQVYRTDNGYDFTGITSGTGDSAAVIDLEGILVSYGISRDRILSGVFDNAKINLFATTWKNPIEDEEPLGFGFFGRVSTEDFRYKTELMTGQDVLTQSFGMTYTPQCEKEFGGQEFGGCKKNLASLTVTGSITSVETIYQFSDSARSEVTDYFTAGKIWFTSGDNQGLKAQEIQYFDGGGFTIFEPFYHPINIGDNYTLVPGCRKRLIDCKNWANQARFGGFLYVPTGSTYQKVGTNA